ncbi:MAG: ParB N-terminal domain-containing protein [Thermoguttaceae bacterium]
MKIQVSAIRPNPHRDFNHNPIRADQVAKLVESIGRTGFWDNVVVRPSPSEAGCYELAYGHNRIAAVEKVGIDTVDVPVRDLSDWDMYLCMVDENNTQQNVTTEIVMENIGVGAKLLETYIRQAETAEAFEKLTRSAPNESKPYSAANYATLRNSVLAGCGVGKELIQTYVPDASKSAGVVSTVLEALYGEQRKKREAEKAAALKAAAEKAAKEQAARKAEQEAAAARRAEQEAAAAAAQRAAQQKAKDEAEQHARQKEAEAAERRAEKARQEEAAAAKRAADAAARQKKAEEEAAAHDAAVKKAAREFGVSIEILRSFSSPTVMAEFAMLVKSNKIPEQFHVACAEACHAGEWSQKTMREKIPAWWYVQSGQQGRDYARQAEQAKKEAEKRKYQNGDLPGFIMKFMDGIKDAMLRRDDVLPLVRHASPTLRANLVREFTGHVAVLNAMIEAAGEDDRPQEKEVVVETLPMLPHQL